ncbi:MAG: zinc metallopeptidase [Clostridia bacterium]|nr:zinc metallopeptidase [Clostridia bacterium]
MGYYYGFDMTYIIFVLPAIILSLWASANVNSTFNKYRQFGNSRGLTGADVARKILDMNGLYNVKVERIAGNLTDHFDPKSNVIRLSDATHSSTSVAAIGVAAHEAGHAVQHATGYTPIKFRNAIVPVAQISSYAAWPLVLIGLVLNSPSLAEFGIILFSCVVLFQIVTLPVEFNASRRAIQTLNNNYILEGDELFGAKKVLKAAALTYVAAAAVAIGQLLRLLVLTGGRNRD